MEAVVHTKNGCPHCVNAKALLKRKGIAFTEVLYDTPEAIEGFKSMGFRTFPQVYVDGDLIGGFDALNAHLDDDF